MTAPTEDVATSSHAPSSRPRSMLRTPSPRSATPRFAPTTASAPLIPSCVVTTRQVRGVRARRGGADGPARRTSIRRTPNADKRTDETMSRVNEPATAELHQMCADEMAAETSGDSHQRTD